MFTENVDIAGDCTIGFMFEILEKHNVKMELIAARGPGGGNPFVKIIAKNQSDLDSFLAFHNG